MILRNATKKKTLRKQSKPTNYAIDKQRERAAVSERALGENQTLLNQRHLDL